MSSVSDLHKLHHDNYDSAKDEIHQSLGSIKDIEVWGRQVLVAVYVRPQFTEITDVHGKKQRRFTTAKTQTEDVYQGKAVLILKLGPDAFTGTDEYLKAKFGSMPPPSPGDWVFVRPQEGTPINLCGDGASRPQGEDFKGTPIDLYEWDGWPCRMVNDEAFMGRINKPHEIV